MAPAMIARRTCGDFAPFSFRLVAGKSEKLVDSKGRSIWSIFAEPISNEDLEAIKQVGRSDQDDVLRAMLEHPGKSLHELAEHLQWRTMQGEPSRQPIRSENRPSIRHLSERKNRQLAIITA
jgi:hypothetical protein